MTNPLKRSHLNNDQAQYGSREWIANTLGKSMSWLEKNMARLIESGFPKPDPLIGKTYKPDVFEWMERRRKFKIRGNVDASLSPEGENLEKL